MAKPQAFYGGYNEAMGTAAAQHGLPEDGLRGWVLYDDYCGFCRRWVPLFGKTLARRGIGVSPNHLPWVTEALGLKPGERVGDICLLLRDGERLLGADAYRYAMRRIWWAYPMYLFSILPVGRSCFDFGYRTFARNRYRFSRACRLPGADEVKADKAGG